MAFVLIKVRLKELRRERNWSRETLSHVAYAIDPGGTSVAQITAIERGVRRASERSMLALAAALEVEPEEFPEYRLALARHVLDEEKVGIEEAMGRLEQSGLEPTGVTPKQIKDSSRDGRREKGKLDAGAAAKAAAAKARGARRRAAG